jgi:hypothetical protein
VTPPAPPAAEPESGDVVSHESSTAAFPAASFAGTHTPARGEPDGAAWQTKLGFVHGVVQSQSSLQNPMSPTPSWGVSTTKHAAFAGANAELDAPHAVCVPSLHTAEQ